jgi:outer membrane protein assembly factor BamB
MIDGQRLAEKWPESGPPMLWSRPLGTGHSAIVVDDGRLYTMYRAGNGRGGRGRSQGPWNADETVVALDAKTGKTVWEHTYASRREDFSFGAGPHSTPLVVGDRLFTIGTNQQLLAFEKRTGTILWSHDFIKEFNSPELLIRPVVKTGYACSPIAYRDTIICSVGGPDSL